MCVLYEIQTEYIYIYIYSYVIYVYMFIYSDACIIMKPVAMLAGKFWQFASLSTVLTAKHFKWSVRLYVCIFTYLFIYLCVLYPKKDIMKSQLRLIFRLLLWRERGGFRRPSTALQCRPNHGYLLTASNLVVSLKLHVGNLPSGAVPTSVRVTGVTHKAVVLYHCDHLGTVSKYSNPFVYVVSLHSIFTVLYSGEAKLLKETRTQAKCVGDGRYLSMLYINAPSRITTVTSLMSRALSESRKSACVLQSTCIMR
jgi:hypothetical protein